jgi:hypothetical protein
MEQLALCADTTCNITIPYFAVCIRRLSVYKIERQTARLVIDGLGSERYSYASHNDVSVNDGPHIRRWSHKIR